MLLKFQWNIYVHGQLFSRILVPPEIELDIGIESKTRMDLPEPPLPLTKCTRYPAEFISYLIPPFVLHQSSCSKRIGWSG
jgi:hypothetical protein